MRRRRGFMEKIDQTEKERKKMEICYFMDEGM